MVNLLFFILFSFVKNAMQSVNHFCMTYIQIVFPDWTYIPTTSVTGMEYQLIAYGEEANHTELQDYCTEPSSNFRPKTNKAISRVMQRFRGYFKYSCRIWIGIFRNGSAWIDRNGEVVTPHMWKRGQPELSDMNAFIYLHNKTSKNFQWTGTHNFTPMERDYFICQRGKIIIFLEDNMLHYSDISDML